MSINETEALKTLLEMYGIDDVEQFIYELEAFTRHEEILHGVS